MEYTKAVKEKVELVNNVLDEFEADHLFDNRDFSIDEMSMESWLKINLNSDNTNRVPLSLTFSQNSLEIRLDRITEAIDWSNKDIKDSRPKVLTILKNIISSHILVEYYGQSHTTISFFSRNGKCTNKLKYKEGFSIRGKREVRLYNPIYNIK